MVSRQTEDYPSATAERGGGGGPAAPKAALLEGYTAEPAVPQAAIAVAATAAAAPRRMSVMKPPVRNDPATRKYSLSVASQQEVPEDAPSLPRAPCFGATLSPAAQFSAFKCYEDLIEEKLNETFPDRSWTLPQRCLTPEKTIVLHITPEDASVVASDTAGNKRPQSPLLEPGSPTDAEVSSPTLAAEGVQLRQPSLLVPVKQLNVTKRFQVAMDMIDSMKKTRGLLPTSPRVVEKCLADPDNQLPADDGEVHVKSFKNWNSLWTKEFRL